MTSKVNSKKRDNVLFVVALIVAVIGFAAAGFSAGKVYQHRADQRLASVIAVNCTAAGMMIGELYAGISDGSMEGAMPLALLKREVDYLDNCGTDTDISARISAETKDELGKNPELKKFPNPGSSVQR